jgi:hypothetical protein
VSVLAIYFQDGYYSRGSTYITFQVPSYLSLQVVTYLSFQIIFISSRTEEVLYRSYRSGKSNENKGSPYGITEHVISDNTSGNTACSQIIKIDSSEEQDGKLGHLRMHVLIHGVEAGPKISDVESRLPFIKTIVDAIFRLCIESFLPVFEMFHRAFKMTTLEIAKVLEPVSTHRFCKLTNNLNVLKVSLPDLGLFHKHVAIPIELKDTYRRKFGPDL